MMVSIISCSSSPHDQHHPYGFTAQRTAVSNAWPGGGGNGSLLTQAACRRRALSPQAHVCVYTLADAHTHACMRTHSAHTCTSHTSACTQRTLPQRDARGAGRACYGSLPLVISRPSRAGATTHPRLFLAAPGCAGACWGSSCGRTRGVAAGRTRLADAGAGCVGVRYAGSWLSSKCADMAAARLQRNAAARPRLPNPARPATRVVALTPVPFLDRAPKPRQPWRVGRGGAKGLRHRGHHVFGLPREEELAYDQPQQPGESMAQAAGAGAREEAGRDAPEAAQGGARDGGDARGERPAPADGRPARRARAPRAPREGVS